MAQAALLAGRDQRAQPVRSPHRTPTRPSKRRNLVLRRMHDQGYITDEQRIGRDRRPGRTGCLRPRRPRPSRYPAPHFVDAVKEWLLKDSDALGATPGRAVQQPLSAVACASRRPSTSTPRPRPRQSIDDDPQGPGRRSEDPRRRAGVDRSHHRLRAGHGRRLRLLRHPRLPPDEPGRWSAVDRSAPSFKPIVLATALTNGVPRTEVVRRAQQRRAHRVRGARGGYGGGGIGSGNLDDCTVASSNTCYANIILDPQVTPERSVEMAQRLGIRHTKLAPNPSVVLGTNLTTVEDMASVYATFANNGRVRPARCT